MICFLLSLLNITSILGGLFSCDCSDRPTPDFACQANSSALEVTYPVTGISTCGIIYPLEEPQPTPTLSVLVDLPGENFYTVLLVDTSTSILHFGAVNWNSSFLETGNIDLDGAPNVFSDYRGPSPPWFLQLLSSNIYRSLFNYEWMLIEQQSGQRDVPQSVTNFGFDYKEFIGSDPVILNSYFSSGFCVKERTS